MVVGPRRGLFLACLFVGFGSLLALDFFFAPAALSAGEAHDEAAGASSATSSSSSNPAVPVPARVVIPALARVPTIVARFDSASKEPVDEAAIRVLATAMIEDHDVTIVLEGHSDTRGGDDYNHTISLERANWVKARLVTLGVSDDRIEAVGFGATRPLRSDEPDTPSVNRRVEVRWLGSASRGAEQPPRPAPRPMTSQTASVPREPQRARDAGAEAASPAEPGLPRRFDPPRLDAGTSPATAPLDDARAVELPSPTNERAPSPE
jgi:outer membrane protein OmpA-like peptidoglycan-associated protein